MNDNFAMREVQRATDCHLRGERRAAQSSSLPPVALFGKRAGERRKDIQAAGSIVSFRSFVLLAVALVAAWLLCCAVLCCDLLCRVVDRAIDRQIDR